jgi:hypothetical protein
MAQGEASPGDVAGGRGGDLYKIAAVGLVETICPLDGKSTLVSASFARGMMDLQVNVLRQLKNPMS